MHLADPLPIRPFARPVQGEVTLPGSKSVTNRALLLAALCDGPVTLTGALFSEDTRIMAEALRKLGISVSEDAAGAAIKVAGQKGAIPAESAELFVGNAGTAARFLTALCAASPRGVFKLDGVPVMRRRPMKGLIEALRTQGAEIRCLGEEGFFPIEIRAHGLKGGLVKIDASASSQMLSALILVAPLARQPMVIDAGNNVRWPFVEMTLRFAESFIRLTPRIRPDDGRIHPSDRPYRSPGVYSIEPDATAASYFMALPLAVGGSIHISGLSIVLPMLQGDIAFAEVVRSVGAMVSERGAKIASARDKIGYVLANPASPGIDVSVGPGASLRGIGQNFREFSDTFLTLAAISPLLSGPTTLTGISHTRKQETDRVAGMAAELAKLGQAVTEKDDSLEIHPRPIRRQSDPIEIETYGDHRFAMSFAILGCHDLRGDGSPWLSIKDPGCCAKTFPRFFEVLESVRPKS